MSINLNLTPEQIAEEFRKNPGANFITVDACGTACGHKEKPYPLSDDWNMKDSSYVISDFIDNWRELCFERPKENIIKPTIDESASILKCRDCGIILHVFLYWPKEGKVTLDFSHHECKRKEEKPVNEACLFKPVLARDFDDQGWAEVIFMGFDNGVFIGTLNASNKDCEYFSGASWLQWKRIPGYDYGD